MAVNAPHVRELNFRHPLTVRPSASFYRGRGGARDDHIDLLAREIGDQAVRTVIFDHSILALDAVRAAPP